MAEALWSVLGSPQPGLTNSFGDQREAGLNLSDSIFKKSMICISSACSSQLRLTKGCLAKNTGHYFHDCLGYREHFGCCRCLEMLGLSQKRVLQRGEYPSPKLVCSLIWHFLRGKVRLSKSQVSQPNLF